MSGGRGAGAGGAATSREGGGSCSCTKIAVMQLFHELKQQFPTVADDVVNACIVDHCHDRPACHQRLQQAAAVAVPRTLPRSRPNPQQPIGMTSLQQQQQQQQNQQPSSTKLSFLSPTGRKPPISPSTQNKRFPSTSSRNSKYDARVSRLPQDNDTCAGVSVTDLSKHFTQQCEVISSANTNANITRAFKQTSTSIPTASPVRPASLDLPPRRLNNCENVTPVSGNTNPVTGSVNVSVNLNCSVDLVPSPGHTPGSPATRRHSTVLQVTPEPVWCQHNSSTCSGMSSSDSSPRSYTSVNLTLRTPTSDPQAPIDICSSPVSGPSLTYTTSSFDRRQGLESCLQIIVGPGAGVGTVTAVRTRPRWSYHPEGATIEQTIPPPIRAESLPDLVYREKTAATTNHVVLLSRQLERKELLKNELEAGRERLNAIKKEVHALQLENSPEFRTRLKKEIRHLQAQCERLTQDVDRHSESGGGVPLGEINADFYRHIYKGQRDSLRPRQREENHRLPPSSIHSSVVENDNEPHWQCHLCTFRNHPLMNKCEQCEMPRVLLGNIVQDDSHEDVLFPNRPHASSNPPFALGVGMNS